MKKLLLIACAMVAMTANAQKLATVSNADKNMVGRAPISKVNFKMTEGLTIKDMSTLVSKAKAKAPAQADIYGDYVEDCYTWMDDENGLHEDSDAKLAAYEYTDEETGDTLELVSLSIGDGYCEVIGEYNAEEGKLYIPVGQLCFNDETYGRFAYFGIDAEDNIIQGEDEYVTYTLDEETGIFTCDDAGYVVYMVDYSEEAGNTYFYIVKYESYFIPSNGTMSYVLNKGNGWEADSCSVAIEDYETNVNVYGFIRMGMVSLDINEDLTVTINVPQPLYYGGSSYGVFNLYHCPVTDDGYLEIDYSEKETGGILDGNTIYFADPETYQYNYYIVIQPEEVGNYWRGYHAKMAITLNNGNFLAGIDTPTLEERIKNTKTYNLMGQQVNRDSFKGLMIRDGKKIVKK